jgi:hypothetical protein
MTLTEGALAAHWQERGIEMNHCRRAWMGQFPNRPQNRFGRTGVVEERTSTLQSHLFQTFLLRRSNYLKATCKVIWDLNRHRFPQYCRLLARSRR